VNEGQQSDNEFWRCNLYKPRAVQTHIPMIQILGGDISKLVTIDVAVPGKKRQQSGNGESKQRQQSVNRESTILGAAWCLIVGMCNEIYPSSKYL